MKNIFKDLKSKDHKRYLGGLDVFRYIGPGLLVTVGFIDPGNWASNFAAGSEFGYSLLWVVTLSTIMLIILQHNVAHLGRSWTEALPCCKRSLFRMRSWECPGWKGVSCITSAKAA